MFAKCVSRTGIAAVLAFALLLPAAGVLAAPASSDTSTGWFASVDRWLDGWTDNVLDLLRWRPADPRAADDPSDVTTPSFGDDALQRAEGDETAMLDPDG